MLKLTPILEEVPEDIYMSGYEGSGGHDRKLHQALPFHVGGGIGPESITRKSEMANHNSRVIETPLHLLNRLEQIFQALQGKRGRFHRNQHAIGGVEGRCTKNAQ